MTSRSYCFTSFKAVDDFTYEKSKIKYIIYGVETCKKTHRLHLQGYVELKNAYRIAAVKKILNDPSVHLEKRQGTRDEAITYCRKDGVVTEYGQNEGQGSRTDLKISISDAKTVKDFAQKNPELYCRYRGGIKDLMAWKLEDSVPEFRFVDVTVYWGATGTGKTRSVEDESKECGNRLYTLGKDGDRCWFDGYDGQEILHLEEFNGWMPYSFLLRVLDGYRLRLPIKGGHTFSAWTMVYITSNVEPSRWYSFGMTPALQRRLGFVKEFKSVGVSVDCPPLGEAFYFDD